ncbi:MAG: hypothetical protein QM756_08805 [Polyangiaceae bacterium]
MTVMVVTRTVMVAAQILIGNAHTFILLDRRATAESQRQREANTNHETIHREPS